jgi:aspartyl protease family protein
MRALLIALASLLLTSPAFAGSATLERAQDGHFWAEAKINGRPVHALVDTGASLVALTKADAKRAGVDVANLRYTVSVDTAAGKSLGAPVKLERIAIAGARLENVDAIVLKSGLSVSILGMSYLGRLNRMDVRGASMRLED